jgi:hypothetical protein
VGHDIRIKEKQKVVHETVIQKPNQEPPKLREKKNLMTQPHESRAHLYASDGTDARLPPFGCL